VNRLGIPYKDYRKCSLCGYCEINCPTFLEYRDLLKGPRWRVQSTILLDEGKINLRERVVESLYSCLTCGSCNLKCPLNFNIPEIVITGRATANSEASNFLPQNSFILSQIKRHRNPLGFKSKAKWAEELGISQKGKTLLFVGCLYPFIDKLKVFLELGSKVGVKELSSLANLLYKFGFNKAINHLWRVKEERLYKIGYALRSLGYELSYLRDEPCCGEILYNMGFVDEFETHARHFASYLKEKGVRKMISLSPFCGYTLKEIYPKIIDSWDIEVITLVEAIEERFEGGSIEELKVTYHDPCYYSRHLGIVNEPRGIMERIKGLELIEPEHHGANTLCVGDGGVELYYPEYAYRIAERRVDELLDTNAKVIVTQCPACIAMIEWILKKRSSGVEVKDIGEVVFDSMHHHSNG